MLFIITWVRASTSINNLGIAIFIFNTSKISIDHWKIHREFSSCQVSFLDISINLHSQHRLKSDPSSESELYSSTDSTCLSLLENHSNLSTPISGPGMIESRALHALTTTYLQPQNGIYLSEVERLKSSACFK